MPFKDLGLAPSLVTTLDHHKLIEPTPIQLAAIPPILKRKDVLGIAPTGSGKTASYILPILSYLVKNDQYKNRHIRALVIVPTRELAVQVLEFVHLFTTALPRRIKSTAIYGGVSVNPQMIGLQHVELLIATPGRLIDLLDRGALSLSDVSILVMDEADQLLNAGFKKELDQIIHLLPVRRQNLLFSATLSPDVHNIQHLLLTDPLIIDISPVEKTPVAIDHQAYLTTDERKGPFLRYLIKKQGTDQALVFCSSINKTDKVAHKLYKNGVMATAIHGNLSQRARSIALSQFKSKKFQVLVTTDLLARGIDIEQMPYVINYEL
ncbi:UNVERIFIED_CONTAM: hypothetical protein GTU68_052994, partial [Idotea baltica]|nr:hypothetical protein [Idotea baltica]